MLRCSVSSSQPLGGQLLRVFSDGGYASIRTPLLPAQGGAMCGGIGFLSRGLPESPVKE